MSRASVFSISVLFVLHCLTASAQQQSFSRTISTASESVTVDFNPFPIRSSNFGVLVQNDSGNFNPYDFSGPRTYLGTIRGYPGAMASGLLKANGVLLCRISFEDGVEWSSTGGVASVKGSSDWKFQIPTSHVPPANADSVIFVAEVGVDATYQEFLATGSTTNDTIDMIEFSIMAANVPFIRDASILHKIGKVVIRASQSMDPYGGSTNTNVLLTTVRSQWNSVIAGIVGRTHHLALSVRPGAGGGLAYVGTVATSNGYSGNGAESNGDFSVIWRHEAGHNWGSGHYEGGGRPEGRTIMSDNRLSRFSSSELIKILNYKIKVPQLASNVSIPRPPRANLDIAIMPSKQPFIINVLANDLDANIKGLKISSVQSPSALGSTLKILGPSKQQQGRLEYIPSLAASLSVDYFSYSIQNMDGRTATGYVAVHPEHLIAWWKMEESSGATMQDFLGNTAQGTITGSTIWDKGNGLIFGGSGKVSFNTKPSLTGTSSFSISVWVKVPKNFTSNGVIIQQRSPPLSSTNGYNGEYQLLVTSGKPRFMVFGDNAYQFSFSASTSIADEQSHHVVATRDNKSGRIYVDSKLSGSANGELRKLDKNIPVFMGWDARNNNAFLTGTLMGARIYNRSLSLDEVSYLSTHPEALMGWWKMDETSGTILKDSSGNFATGTITGSTTWDQDGGLSFKGAGKVSLGTVPSLGGKKSFSIHAWVKVPSSFTSKGVIIQQRSKNGFNGEYQLYVTGGKPRFLVFGDGSLQFDFSASASINDGQWHHIVAVRDHMEGRIYIDGNLSGSASGNARNLDANIPVFIGWDSRANNYFFSGSLKGVKVYNQVVNMDPEATNLLASA